VLRLGLRPLMSARPGTIIISHVPPRGAGDTPDDPYHVGFDAYAFLAGRIRPRLWIHGHTNVAAKTTWRVQHGPTTVVNATGSVLVELTPTSIELRADEPNDGGPTNP
jgi:Icc-related predicted phosphoesterase